MNHNLLRKKDKTLPLVKFLVTLISILFFLPSFSQITVNVQNKPLRQTLKEIEKVSNYRFFYNESLTILDKNSSIQLTNSNIDNAMQKLLAGTDVTYEKNNNIVVLVDQRNSNNQSGTSQQDKVTVRGRVLDVVGEPIIGANIIEEGGSGNGTVTDYDGNFTLTTSRNSKVKITYIGYLPHEISASENTIFDIILQEDTQTLDEIVVVGYGTMKRTSVTGAISTVSSEILQSRPINNPLSALQGEIPGMLIQRYSGQPGNEGFSMNVRGIASTNGDNEPLVIIDGVAGDINLLNADDIESISVLKDAQAAIYGARAAGGVFLVTTKSGKRGKPSISYNGNFAITKSAGMMKSPTTYEMAIMDNEANIHNGATPMYSSEYLDRIKRNDPNPIPHPLYGGWMLFFTNTNWLNELLDNGFQQRHNLNISGGGDNSDYYLSAGFIDQRGVVKYANDNNKRYNLRLNYNYNFFDRVKLETRVSLENQKRTDIGGIGDWVIGEAIYDMPNHPIYNPSGNFFAQGGWSNSVAYAKEGVDASFKTNRVNTNIKATTRIIDELRFILQAGITQSLSTSKEPATSVPLYTWDDQIAYYAIANPSEANLTQTSAESLYQNYTGYFQFNKVFDKKHRLDLMTGVTHEKNEYDDFSAWRDGFMYNNLWSLNLGGTNNMWNNGSGIHWGINSLFGRISYDFDEKYLFETNFRYDGSSRFAGSDRRWGFFPGVSVGWRLSNEDFMKSVKFVNEMRIRASYGETGNQEGIGLYDFVQKIIIGKNEWGDTKIYPFGPGTQTPSARLDGMVASNRTWETIINQNIGIDGSLFNNKISFSFDYFIKKNKNMLIPISYPSLIGVVAPSSNSGEMKTWGFDYSITWKDKIGSLDYFVKLIMSDAQNEIVHYGGADTYNLGMTRIRQGYPINSYFAYEFDGLIRNQEELSEYKKLGGVPSNINLGDARFKDLNKDGVISTYASNDDGDVKYVGNSSPRYNYGVTFGGKISNFDLNVFFQGVGERTLFRVGDYAMPWSDWWRQPPHFYYMQTWNEDRQDAYYPRLSHGDIRYWNYQPSTLQKINAAYLRLKNLQIGYTLPNSSFTSSYFPKIRVYFSGQDLWEYHKVKGGWDPESADWGGNYPFQRYYSFGVDITF